VKEMNITIPRKLTHGEELIVVPRKEYEGMKKRLEEFKDAIRKISKGEEELKKGKTETVGSLSELL